MESDRDPYADALDGDFANWLEYFRRQLGSMKATYRCLACPCRFEQEPYTRWSARGHLARR